MGYNGPLVLAMSLNPVAEPSAKYTKKYDEATALQKELEKEQRQLEAQQARLEERQAALERRQRELERQGASLERQGAALERQGASLEAQKIGLDAHTAALRERVVRTGRKIAPLAARLAFIEARERRVERLIEQTTDPDELRRLKRRLALCGRRRRASVHGLRRWSRANGSCSNAASSWLARRRR